ncbi:uncharacterized protein LOC118743585 [Rhagoletis pomonella]|uniref:uncharacterized protein LOC118743585 n=1 Tax=Rhagoletis pomonella TaxID=28610 RepID=UPI001780315E|nr:uncharacterized protein LOC118743585 [Rhagoletis pomonella]
MRGLSHGGVSEDFLRTMWLQRLPSQTQAVLATSSEALDKLAVMADKIQAISAPQSTVAAVQSFPELIDLQQQISTLSTAVSNLQKKRFQHRSRSSSRGRYKAESAANTSEWCYYHRRFGPKARNCRQPCTFKQRRQGNSPAGH